MKVSEVRRRDDQLQILLKCAKELQILISRNLRASMVIETRIVYLFSGSYFGLVWNIVEINMIT